MISFSSLSCFSFRSWFPVRECIREVRRVSWMSLTFFLPSSSLSFPTCDHYQSVIYQATTHGVGDNEDKTEAIEVEGQQEDIRESWQRSLLLPLSTSSSPRFFHQENLSGRVLSQEKSSSPKRTKCQLCCHIIPCLLPPFSVSLLEDFVASLTNFCYQKRK